MKVKFTPKQLKTMTTQIKKADKTVDRIERLTSREYDRVSNRLSDLDYMRKIKRHGFTAKHAVEKKVLEKYIRQMDSIV